MAGGDRVCGTVVHAHGAGGFSFVELLLVVALIATMTGLTVPVTAHAIDDGRARQAAGFMASQLRLARQQAALQGRVVGLLFDRVGSRWTFRMCVDGNGDGVRRAEVSTGTDVCPDIPLDLEGMFPGLEVAVDAGLPGPDGEAGSADAVRFGRSDLASFSPEGTATAGTLFLRSRRGRQYAVRVGNVTGRIRLLRYDTGARKWVTG